jgi:UDP-2,3-diacylglucosamine pyrophosphatase LpxH
MFSREPVSPSGRTVVISDAHFGEEGAMLACPAAVERFLGELSAGGPVEEVVLLGDTWDLWRADLATALRESRHFLGRLYELPVLRRLVVVFGNHDHHLFFNPAENRALGGAGTAADTCHPVIPPPFIEERDGLMRSLLKVPESISLVSKYPFHRLERREGTVLLTHGHQVDFFARRFWWAKTAWLARLARRRVRGVSASDLELLNAPFFEALYLFGRVPDFSRRTFRWYRLLRGAARLAGITASGSASIRRFSSLDENAREVKAALSQLYPGSLPDVFVFGHTHRAGHGRLALGSRPLEIFNTGCWLEEDNATPGTWLELAPEGITLRTLQPGH